MFLQRLHLIGQVLVFLGKGGEGQLQYLAHSSAQHQHFVGSLLGKDQSFAVYLFGGLCQIQSVVADSLKIAEGMKNF